jgi:hypothetical protein
MPVPGFSARTTAWLQVTVLIVAPAVALAGYYYHPWIGRPHDAVFFWRLAVIIDDDPTRWAVSHLLIAAGSALLAVAFLAIRSRLREAGEERWSAFGLPFIVAGSTLYALLPGVGFAPLGAYAAGADPGAVQAALMPWRAGILQTSAAIFALGLAGFAVAIVRADILSPGMTWLVVAALVVLGVSRFFPAGIAQLYVGPAAGVVALWPLAYAVWAHQAVSTARQPKAGTA